MVKLKFLQLSYNVITWITWNIFYNLPNTVKQVTGPSYSSPHEVFLLLTSMTSAQSLNLNCSNNSSDQITCKKSEWR